MVDLIAAMHVGSFGKVGCSCAASATITAAWSDDGAPEPHKRTRTTAYTSPVQKHLHVSPSHTATQPAVPAPAAEAPVAAGGGAVLRKRKLSHITATSNAHVPCKYREQRVVAAKVKRPGPRAPSTPGQRSNSQQAVGVQPSSQKNSVLALKAAAARTVQVRRSCLVTSSTAGTEAAAVNHPAFANQQQTPGHHAAFAGATARQWQQEEADQDTLPAAETRHVNTSQAAAKIPNATEQIHVVSDVFKVVDGVAMPLDSTQNLKRCSLCMCDPLPLS